jgi:hypothetical protein
MPKVPVDWVGHGDAPNRSGRRHPGLRFCAICKKPITPRQEDEWADGYGFCHARCVADEKESR